MPVNQISRRQREGRPGDAHQLRFRFGTWRPQPGLDSDELLVRVEACDLDRGDALVTQDGFAYAWNRGNYRLDATLTGRPDAK